jgi:hypothetical protein
MILVKILDKHKFAGKNRVERTDLNCGKVGQKHCLLLTKGRKEPSNIVH